MLWEKYKKPGKKVSFIGIIIHILLNKKKLYWFYKSYKDGEVKNFFRYSLFLVLKRLSKF